jgi:hypothetical protein
LARVNGKVLNRPVIVVCKQVFNAAYASVQRLHVAAIRSLNTV